MLTNKLALAVLIGGLTIVAPRLPLTSRTQTRLSPRAKAAQQAASSVGGEWRDTGKLIEAAERQSPKATSVLLSTSPSKAAEGRGMLGKDQALSQRGVGNRSICTTESGLTMLKKPAIFAGFCASLKAALVTTAGQDQAPNGGRRADGQKHRRRTDVLWRGPTTRVAGPEAIDGRLDCGAEQLDDHHQQPTATSGDRSTPLPPSHPAAPARPRPVSLAECRLVAITSVKPWKE